MRSFIFPFVSFLFLWLVCCVRVLFFQSALVLRRIFSCSCGLFGELLMSFCIYGTLGVNCSTWGSILVSLGPGTFLIWINTFGELGLKVEALEIHLDTFGSNLPSSQNSEA